MDRIAAQRNDSVASPEATPTAAGPLDPQQSAQRGQSAELNAADGGRHHGPPRGSVPPVVPQGAGFVLQDFAVGQADLLGAHRTRLTQLADELNAEAQGVRYRERVAAAFESDAQGRIDYDRPILDADGTQRRYGDARDPKDPQRGWQRVEVIVGSASPEGEGGLNARLAEGRATNVAATLEGLGPEFAHGKAAGWLGAGSHGPRGDLRRPETWPTHRQVEVRVRPRLPLPGEQKAAPTPELPPAPTPDLETVPLKGLEAVVPRNALGRAFDAMPGKEGGVATDVGVEIAGELGADAVPLLWTLKGGLEMYSALNDAHLQDNLVVACRAFLWGFAARASGLNAPPYDTHGFSGAGDPAQEAELLKLWQRGLSAGATEVTAEHEAFFRSPTPRKDPEGKKAAALQQLWDRVSAIPGAGTHVRDSDLMAWPGHLR